MQRLGPPVTPSTIAPPRFMAYFFHAPSVMPSLRASLQLIETVIAIVSILTIEEDLACQFRCKNCLCLRSHSKDVCYFCPSHFRALAQVSKECHHIQTWMANLVCSYSVLSLC